MNGVSCQPLKNRRPHGVFWFLLSVLLVLSAAVSSRAQTNSTMVITNSDGLTNIASGGTFTFATSGTFTITNAITVTNSAIIDATGLNVVLTGTYTNRLFFINNKNVTLTLINLEITGGKDTLGAAIYNNFGTLIASNVVFAGNRATNAQAANGANGSSGNIAGSAGHTGITGQGGAIYSNKGSLILTNCTFTNNIVAGGNGGNGGNGFNGLGGDGGDGGQGGGAYGGAIYSTGTNSISGCYFVANGAFGGSGGGGGAAGGGTVGGDTGAGGQGVTGAGAAIYIPAGGILNVTNCTFEANQAFGGDSGPQAITANGFSDDGKTGGTAIGGAIENFGTFYIENSTFFTNSCTGGKGGDTLGDSAANAGAGGPAIGGAICNAATFVARNCTFATNNVIGGAKGISPFSNRNGAPGTAQGGNLARISGTSKIINSILQHGLGADNSGTLTDGDYNISSDTSCGFKSPSHSLSKTNAILSSSLSVYPGYPPLFEIFGGNSTNSSANGTNNLVRSPALDFILPQPADNPTNFPATDGRGYPRLPNERADAGAFEFVPTPPRILTQPQDAFATTGDTVTFSVFANGQAPLAYQWLFLGTNGNLIALAVATNSSLTISNVQTTNYGTYSVVVTNDLGSATSSNAVLSPVIGPSITNRPLDLTLPIGGTAVFSVGASGGPLNFQWFFNDAALTNVGNITGATTASLTVSSVTASNQGTYKVSVTNSQGSPSTTVQLTVEDPAITSQPADATVNYNSSAIFSVGVVSSTNVTFQWFRGASKINNQTNASFTNITSTVSTNFSVVVSNRFGGPSTVVTSRVATLTVLNPAITIPPTNVVVDVGSNAIFKVTAAGSPTLKYQWTYNGVNITNPPATNSSLTISSVTNTESGTYAVIVSNTNGTVTSTPVTLTVRGFSGISGRVTFGTNGVSGVVINDGATNVITSADGSYSFVHLLAGTYMITPVQIGSGLTPTNTAVVVDGVSSTNNIDFIFNPPELQITSAITNDAVPLQILSAPGQELVLQSSTDLTNWANARTFTPDTNGTWNVTVTNTPGTNTIAAPEFFLRVISP